MIGHLGKLFRVLLVSVVILTVVSVVFQISKQIGSTSSSHKSKRTSSPSPSSPSDRPTGALLRQNYALKKQREDLLQQQKRLKLKVESLEAVVEAEKSKDEPLDCVPLMLQRLEEVQDQMDPFYHDFFRIFIETKLTVGNQKRFFASAIAEEKGYYIRSAADLEARLERDGRCWSKEVLGLPPNERFPNIAVCLEQHSNGPTMQEYISHYLLLGVSKIIIYDNSNPDSIESKYFRMVVQPFVELGYVIVNDFYFPEVTDGDFKPIDVFQVCFQKYKDSFDWIGHLDSDEYFVVGNDYRGPPCLTHILPQYNNFGGVTSNWRFIGSAIGHAPEKDAPFIKKYRISMPNEHVKTFYQPKFVTGVDNQHWVNYVPGQTAVSSTRKPVATYFNTEPDAHKLFSLYHFYTGDWDYCFFEKICRFNSIHFRLISWWTL